MYLVECALSISPLLFDKTCNLQIPCMQKQLTNYMQSFKGNQLLYLLLDDLTLLFKLKSDLEKIKLSLLLKNTESTTSILFLKAQNALDP